MFAKPKQKGREMRQVAVTAVGAVTPLGLSWDETWANLIKGASGIGPITKFVPHKGKGKTTIAAEVKGFNPDRFMDPKFGKRLDPFSQYAVAAVLEAVRKLNIDITKYGDRRGCVIGTGVGGIETTVRQVGVLATRGPDRISPFTIPMLMPNAASANAAIVTKSGATSIAPTSACAAGADALGYAFKMIAWGEADIVFAGGSEAAITLIAIAGFNQAGALSTNFNDEPSRASRPFDYYRDGFVMGEGCVVLVLEDLVYALAHGHPILAIMVGYGSTTDASHITAPPPDGEGAVKAMQKALLSAGFEPRDIDYINAHGTSTSLNDRVETLAIKTVFGQHAYRLPVSSTKGQTGHMVGAGGSMEAAVCVYSLMNGLVLPTVNYEKPDPDCDLDYVPNTARSIDIRTALSNSFGFGGHNTSLVFTAA